VALALERTFVQLRSGSRTIWVVHRGTLRQPIGVDSASQRCEHRQLRFDPSDRREDDTEMSVPALLGLQGGDPSREIDPDHLRLEVGYGEEISVVPIRLDRGWIVECGVSFDVPAT
jgi:hypothetical protein